MNSFKNILFLLLFIFISNSTLCQSNICTISGKTTLFKEPNIKKDRLATIEKNTEVKVIDKVKGFYKVILENNKTGFVQYPFIDCNSSVDRKLVNTSKCNYEKNETDDMTGNRVAFLKWERLYKKTTWDGPEELKLRMCFIEGFMYLEIMAMLQSGAYSIDKGENIIFKFADESTMRITNENSEVADFKNLGISSSSTQWISTFTTIINKELKEKLIDKNVIKIRLYTSEGYQDFEIDRKEQSLMLEQLNCLLSLE